MLDVKHNEWPRPRHDRQLSDKRTRDFVAGRQVKAFSGTLPAHPTWRLLITIRRTIGGVISIHPGEHLAEELKELGMSAAERAGGATFRPTASLRY